MKMRSILIQYELENKKEMWTQRQTCTERKLFQDTQWNWSDAFTSKKHLKLPETMREARNRSFPSVF